jgi:hypothetical protein
VHLGTARRGAPATLRPASARGRRRSAPHPKWYGGAREVVDRRGLNRLGEGHRRQDGGEPPGQHRRARPRGAEQEDVMVRTPASTWCVHLSPGVSQTVRGTGPRPHVFYPIRSNVQKDHYEPDHRLKEQLHACLMDDNLVKRLKTLNGLTPYGHVPPACG